MIVENEKVGWRTATLKVLGTKQSLRLRNLSWGNTYDQIWNDTICSMRLSKVYYILSLFYSGPVLTLRFYLLRIITPVEK